MKTFILIIITVTFFLSSCNSKKKDDKNDGQKTKKENTTLDLYNIESEEPLSVKLPEALREISGMTITPDGRLFAHGDEAGTIYQLDIKTGEVIKKFFPSKTGDAVIEADFEDITFANGKFYLLRSKGQILEFSEGENEQKVEYKKYTTKLTSANDVEGLCFDDETNSLLVLCKGEPGEGYEGNRAIYSFSLKTMALDEKPRILIPLKEIKKHTLENQFAPSGIAKHPISKTFFIIAARGNTIIELSKSGEILNQKDLPEKVHRQPEGIIFLKDNTLLISNEGRDQLARIFSYPMQK